MPVQAFVVIDEDNNTSFSSDADASERFETFDDAERRAIELANNSPGQTFWILGVVASVVTAVVPARTTMVGVQPGRGIPA